MISEHIATAKLWDTNCPGLELFGSMELIIDNKHRENMLVEIQTRMDQISEHKAMLEVIIAEQQNLENFLAFAKNCEIMVD